MLLIDAEQTLRLANYFNLNRHKKEICNIFRTRSESDGSYSMLLKKHSSMSSKCRLGAQSAEETHGQIFNECSRYMATREVFIQLIPVYDGEFPHCYDGLRQQ